MKPNCTHCKFYAPVEDSGTVLDYGACRRHPPVPLVDGDGDVISAFPASRSRLSAPWRHLMPTLPAMVTGQGETCAPSSCTRSMEKWRGTAAMSGCLRRP